MAESDKHHCHVCEGCAHIWWHEKTDVTDREKHHRCPKCGCGPYYSAFNTVREAHEVRRLLKAQMNPQDIYRGTEGPSP